MAVSKLLSVHVDIDEDIKLRLSIKKDTWPSFAKYYTMRKKGGKLWGFNFLICFKCPFLYLDVSVHIHCTILKKLLSLKFVYIAFFLSTFTVIIHTICIYPSSYPLNVALFIPCVCVLFHNNSMCFYFHKYFFVFFHIEKLCVTFVHISVCVFITPLFALPQPNLNLNLNPTPPLPQPNLNLNFLVGGELLCLVSLSRLSLSLVSLSRLVSSQVNHLL